MYIVHGNVHDKPKQQNRTKQNGETNEDEKKNHAHYKNQKVIRKQRKGTHLNNAKQMVMNNENRSSYH